jgi:hypothetical protein
MKRTQKQILIVMALLLALPFLIYFVSQTTNLLSHADTPFTPQAMTVTNISDNSFTVTWFTAAKTTGFVQYGLDANNLESVGDDRDNGTVAEHFTHHVTLKNLKPDTQYYFKIGSGNQIYDDKGKPYLQTTAPTTDDPPSVPQPIYGKIKSQNNNPPQEALVFVTINKGHILSSYTREAGNWLITLNNVRTPDMKNYLVFTPQDTLDVVIDAGPEGNASVTTKIAQTTDFDMLTLKGAYEPKKVNLLDSVRANLGKTGEGISGDLNHDKVVNVIDIILAIKSGL